MGAKIDYANARTVEDLDIIYLTGAGFVNEPFKGLSPDSAWGWYENVWGGELGRSKGFTLENIDTVDFGKVSRCEIVFPYVNIKEFEKLRKLLGERHLIVNYYNVDIGGRVTQEMAITNNERERLHNFGSQLIGARNVTVKLVATNRDMTDIGSKFTISYDANGGTGTIANKEVTYADNYSIVSPNPNEFYKTGYRFDYWSTKADGTGWKYLPNERITVWENLTLYAIWVVKEYIGYFAGGDGSINDPYQIENKEQLYNLSMLINDEETNSSYNNLSYILNNDIEFANNESEQWIPIGKNSDLSFSGVFNGNNKNITNITITYSIEDFNSYGLFGYIKNGEVFNLNIKSLNIYGNIYRYIGGIAGQILESGIIRQCCCDGIINISLSSDSPTLKIGGIVGNAICISASTIVECKNNCEITTKAILSVVGGIIGDMNASNLTINKCLNVNEIDFNGFLLNGRAYLGGIAGRGYSIIKNCYNIGDITAITDAKSLNVGGISGSSLSLNVSDCYNIGEINLTTSRNKKSGGIVASYDFSSIKHCYALNGVGYNNLYPSLTPPTSLQGEIKTLIEMKNYNNYIDWDFENVWTVDGSGNRNNGLPYIYDLGV